MANSNNSVITGKLSGSLGKELVFRDWKGKTVVAKAPKARTTEPTPDQVETQDRFLLASRYGKAVLAGEDQGIRDAYAAALRPRQNIYSRALEDFMSPPVVKSINSTKYTGVIGSVISIRAVDDFRVSAVEVEIYNAAGTLLEQGNAVIQLNGVDWTYTTTQANDTLIGSKITAVATDVPGNKDTLDVTL